MTLPENTLEKDKFEEIAGLVHVRTTAKGTFAISGLNKDWVVTTVTIGDVEYPIPLSALPDRNSIIFHNKSGNTVYIGPTGVTADSVSGITSGWEIPAGSYFSLDVKDNIVIYGICETGKTAQLKIMELA